MVFEVSGAPAAVATSTALAKVRGTIVVVAIHPEPRPVDLQRIFWRELTLVGARVYERSDFDAAIKLIGSGVIPTRSSSRGSCPSPRSSRRWTISKGAGL